MIRLWQGRRLERIPLFLRRVVPFIVVGGDGDSCALRLGLGCGSRRQPENLCRRGTLRRVRHLQDEAKARLLVKLHVG